MTPAALALDREERAVDAAMKKYITQTSYKLGVIGATDASVRDSLRDSAKAVQDAFILWRKKYRDLVAKGSPDEEARRLTAAGLVLRTQAERLFVSVKKATPSQMAQIAKGAVGEIADSLAAAGAAIRSGVNALAGAGAGAFGSLTTIIRWAPWIALAAGAAWLLGPRFLAEGIKGFQEGRRGHGTPAGS